MKIVLLFYTYIFLALIVLWSAIVLFNRKKIKLQKFIVASKTSNNSLNFISVFSVDFKNFFIFYTSFFTLFAAQFFFYFFKQSQMEMVRWYYWGSFSFICIVWLFSVYLAGSRDDCR